MSGSAPSPPKSRTQSVRLFTFSNFKIRHCRPLFLYANLFLQTNDCALNKGGNFMKNKNYLSSSVGTLPTLDKDYKKRYNKDAFLEGFNSVSNPFSRKENQTLQKPVFQTLPYRKTYKSGYNERDPFLEGLNSVGTEKNNKKATDVLYKKQPKIKTLPLYQTREAKVEKKTYNPDDIEFGGDSETYKILQDLGKRWYATSDTAEKDRLHGVAEEVRRLSRGNNRVKYGTDEIFDVMHKNAKIGQLVRAASLGTIPLKSLLANPILSGVSGALLEPSAFLTAMTDYGPWDYKRKAPWQTQGTVIIENGKEKEIYDGKDLYEGNRRNWLPWIYFDGYLIGADKFGNMNMAYVGKKMGLPEWVYKNPITMDDPEDILWIDKGINYAETGR